MRSHELYKSWLAAYAEGKLSGPQSKRLEAHLQNCPGCRAELEGFKELEGIMAKLKYPEPPDEVWERYWSGVYNRLERGIGWILTSLGAIILGLYGAFKLVEGLVKDPTVAVVVKIGLLLLVGGLVVLLVSIVRERIFMHRRDRYKEVMK